MPRSGSSPRWPLACLVSAGVLGRPWGYAFGWVVQAAVILSGIWVPVMFFLGAVFAVLWWVALSQGARIEREREAYAREHP